jgi:uncharacterized protein YecE (DUF72 family)
MTNRAHTVWEVTNPELAFIRLHGRNAATWSATGATTASVRFDYDYSDDELREFSGPIRDIANRAARRMSFSITALRTKGNESHAPL